MYDINFELLIILMIIILLLSKNYNIDIKETGSDYNDKKEKNNK